MKEIKQTKKYIIPPLGFGTWKLNGNICKESVERAIKYGYRHIDTADVYENHKEVGAAIRKSEIKRKDIFLTTKVWRDDLSKKNVINSGKRFIEELQTNYIDLLPIHWPNDSIQIEDTLDGFMQLKADGIINFIGVSNFTINHLKKVIETKIPITTNQVEFHPSLYQKKLLDFCSKNNIILTAYCPIAQGEDLLIPEVQNIAKKYNKLPSQIILNWIINKGIIAIPRSSNPHHIKENLESLELNLSPKDFDIIDNIGGNNRIVNPPFSEFNY